MSCTHSTIPNRSFKHLTAYQRGQIERLLRQKVPKTQIANIVGISRSTLYYDSNEVLPNSWTLSCDRYICILHKRDKLYTNRENRILVFLSSWYKPMISYVTSKNRFEPNICHRMPFEEMLLDVACLLSSFRPRYCITTLINSSLPSKILICHCGCVYEASPKKIALTAASWESI